MLQHCCSKGNKQQRKQPLTSADFLCHRVQLQTHLPCQGYPLVLVRPGSENEETPLGTGFEILMPWLREGIETPRSEEDEWQTSIEGCTHYCLFTF